MVTAYSYHNPVILSPDVIWLLISQGFSHYVNENSERLRSLFVDFEGRKTLTVQTEKNIFAPDMDWDAVTADFVKAVRSNLKHKDMADMMLANFSTSGQAEMIASRVTLMNTVEKYFDYKLDETICGIPYITLQGTPDDWKKIAAKVQQLRNYDMGWWADELEPIFYGTEAAENEVRKAVEKLSRWKPATINGIPVPYTSRYQISINVE